jgi:hypothetical protein
MRTDAEWGLLGAFVLMLIGGCGLVLITSGPACMIHVCMGFVLGSLVTAIINQMARWS